MKYVAGLIIGVALVVSWPQETRLVLNNMLEYIELGIDKARQQMSDDEGKSHLGSKAGLLMGLILFSGTSNASFLNSMFWGMMNKDDYMPQAYSRIDMAKELSCYPMYSYRQYAHPYTGQLITLPVRQTRYVAEEPEGLNTSN